MSLEDVFFTWTFWGIVTALTSGAALGWVIHSVRPTVTSGAFLWSGSAIALLWYGPQAVQRFLDPSYLGVAPRSIGAALLFEAFIAVGTLTVAWRRSTVHSA